MNRVSFTLLFFTVPVMCRAEHVYGIADAHISSAAPATNYGALSQLTVGSGSVALIQFDLATLAPVADANSVAKASLVVFVNRVGQAGRMSVAPVLAPWTEAVVTFAGQPPMGTVMSTSDVIVHGNSVVRIDITSQVKSWISAPFSAFGLAISANSTAPGIFFLDSKESVSTSQPAYIEVSFTDSSGLPGPKGDPGAPGPPGALGLAGQAGGIGPAGLAGPDGPLGPDGLQGTTGLKGPKGDAGKQGDPGQRGNVGSTGDRGIKGVNGDHGPVGQKGLTGAVGAIGPNGVQGLAGATGPVGPQGLTNLTWHYYTNTANGNSTNWYSHSCPVGSIVVSGACGHRDANSASNDIILNYFGPDFGNLRTWRCYFQNTNGSSRTIRSGVLCTTAASALSAQSAEVEVKQAPPESAESGDGQVVVIEDPSGAVFQRSSAPTKTSALR